MIDNSQMNEIIQNAYGSLELNNFATLGRPDHKMWETPFFGVADGNDPYFDFLREHIGPFHHNPVEAFRLRYPGEGDPSNLRVVSVCFPQTQETKESQAKESKCPSREWIVTRGEWEPLIREFAEKVTAQLDRIGVRSVSSELVPGFVFHEVGKQGLSSSWSQRHVAFIAGLGTFGLSDGLITQKGKAVRFTSFVMEADLDTMPRQYAGHHDWCLYFQDGSCGLCMIRCPIGAISHNGHDKNACADYEEIFATKYWPADIDKSTYIFGCGLCQVGIPCENQRP